MYADDPILLSATVNGLQAELGLQFNRAKSTCTAIGPGAAHSISDGKCKNIHLYSDLLYGCM